MFPSHSHLVSVQTHLDLSPAQASQEYILEGCPHPFTQTSVFNYSILYVSKNPSDWAFFFFKDGSGGKHCFKKSCFKEKCLTRTQEVDWVTPWWQAGACQRSTQQAEEQPHLTDSKIITHILPDDMKQLESREVMRATQRPHHILWLTGWSHMLPQLKEPVCFMCSWGFYQLALLFQSAAFIQIINVIMYFLIWLTLLSTIYRKRIMIANKLTCIKPKVILCQLHFLPLTNNFSISVRVVFVCVRASHPHTWIHPDSFCCIRVTLVPESILNCDQEHDLMTSLTKPVRSSSWCPWACTHRATVFHSCVISSVV